MKLWKFLLSNKTFFIVVTVAFLGFSANFYYDYSRNLSTRTFRRFLTSYDITSNTFLPYEIVINHRISFGEETVEAMRAVEGTIDVHSLVKVGDTYFSGYPILSGLMALPIYYLPLILNKIPELNYAENLLKLLVLGRLSATFYTSISIGIFYLILKKLLKRLELPLSKWTYLFIFFYAFATDVYSIASRSLWQHTSSLLINSLVILVLIYALEKPDLIKWAGILCGLSFIARPTNIFLVLFVTLYVFIRHRKHFLNYILFSVPAVIALLSYNYFVFGSPFINEYVARSDTSFSTPVWEGLLGYLFSPARSFLFVTPPLVLFYYGFYRLLVNKKRSEEDNVLFFLSLAFLSTMIMLSGWWSWWGADRFGYGFFTEWLPVVGLVTYLVTARFNKIGKVLLILLMVYSLYTQVNGVWIRKSRCSGMHNWTFYCLKPTFRVQEY